MTARLGLFHGLRDALALAKALRTLRSRYLHNLLASLSAIAPPRLMALKAIDISQLTVLQDKVQLPVVAEGDEHLINAPDLLKGQCPQLEPAGADYALHHGPRAPSLVHRAP